MCSLQVSLYNKWTALTIYNIKCFDNEGTVTYTFKIGTAVCCYDKINLNYVKLCKLLYIKLM